MILLNTCANQKIAFEDSEPKRVFSLTTLNITEDTDFNLMDDILVDTKTVSFIKQYHFRWIETKEQVHAIKIEADEDICREFLKEHLSVNSEVFLKNE